MRLSNLFLFAFLVLLSSCSSKRNVVYLQEIDNYKSKSFNYADHIIKNDDILKISIHTIKPEASAIFNKLSDAYAANTIDLIKINGYLVNNSGKITFPILGEIKVSGLNIIQCQELIYNMLFEGGFLKNHSVEVRLLNYNYSVLGEVNKPGTYYNLENNLNIIEAITTAGDLTINGKRNDIKIIREINNKKRIFSIDLTSTDILDSDVFQIQSGDIIIVNPNTNRVKNAGIIGNSGTLLSLLSFITSLVIIISNNN
tara:strand:+ start:1282 stop:2049 length:768 start_codon:yes stop_codon:yes gene_type:complete